MTPSKIVAGVVTAGALIGGGGSIAADNAINPYTPVSVVDQGIAVQALEIAASSTLPEAGTVATVVDTDQPRIELDKWNGEVKMGVTYTGISTATTGARPFLSKNVDWESGAQTMETVPVDATTSMEDGGMEININLASKPASNVFTFQLDNWQNLDFFYQAPLWQEAGLPAAKKDCTDTDCTTSEGISHRPDNVVGSYAVYYKNHANHIEGQTNYATGKAYHIFRPLVTDAVGSTTWATLTYSTGILTVTVPQNFLDTAVYPVKVDPTIGYTTAGASSSAFLNSNNIICSVALSYTASSGDTITSFSFYGNARVSGPRNAAVAAFSIVAGVVTNQLAAKVDIASNITTQWWNSSTVSQSLSAGTTYDIGMSFEDGSLSGQQVYFDSGSAPGYFNSTLTTFPGAGNSFSPTGSDVGSHYSIYATYTAGGGGGSSTYDANNWWAVLQ